MLTLCAERLKSYYAHPRQLIPSLDLANGSARQQRSERREACVLLLTVLLKYMDLASLRVGISTKDGFLSLTVDYIATQTGMTLKRAERALGDLQAAGLVTIAQARKPLPDGSWKWAQETDRLALALKALLGKPGRKPKRKHKPPDDWEYRRRLNLKLAELKAQHWDWSRERLIEEAERMLFSRA